jgi:hypothetical protein
MSRAAVVAAGCLVLTSVGTAPATASGQGECSGTVSWADSQGQNVTTWCCGTVTAASTRRLRGFMRPAPVDENRSSAVLLAASSVGLGTNQWRDGHLTKLA